MKPNDAFLICAIIIVANTLIKIALDNKQFAARFEKPEIIRKYSNILADVATLAIWAVFVVIGDIKHPISFTVLSIIGLYGIFGGWRLNKLKEIRGIYFPLLSRYNQALISAEYIRSNMDAIELPFKDLEEVNEFIKIMELNVDPRREEKPGLCEELGFRESEIGGSLYKLNAISYGKIDYSNKYVYNPLNWFKPATECFDQDAINKLNGFVYYEHVKQEKRLKR